MSDGERHPRGTSGRSVAAHNAAEACVCERTLRGRSYRRSLLLDLNDRLDLDREAERERGHADGRASRPASALTKDADQ